MVKIKFLSIAAMLFLIHLMVVAKLGWASSELSNDYSRLVELIMQEDKTEPLYPFNDFTTWSDTANHDDYLDYLNGKPDLMEKIYAGLGGEKIRWKLADISHRVLYVPEVREEYATLYERYCHDVVSYVLEKTKLKNPYRAIQTLSQERPDIAEVGEGVSAFLVHNVVKESSVTYIFSNSDGKKLEVELNGRVFDGTVGSYGTKINFRENGEFDFIRNKYTLWQNSAANPYTALMVPAEETLHIVLRKYTEKVIRDALEKDTHSSVGDIRKVVDDWISVEEAIVGGLVHALIPDMVGKYFGNSVRDFIETDLDKKGDFKRYHHLKRGIGVVEQLGYMESIKIYMEDPIKFKALLTS